MLTPAAIRTVMSDLRKFKHVRHKSILIINILCTAENLRHILFCENCTVKNKRYRIIFNWEKSKLQLF